MELTTLFRKHKDEEFIFFKPNVGNWGDNLIRLGAEKLANRYDIYFEREEEVKSYPGKIIYIHGVGGIGKVYRGVANKVKDLREYNPDNLIIFGPTTAMLHPNHLKEELPLEDENLIFFAREKTTLNFMRENFNFRIYLDDCPSLHLTEEDIYEFSPTTIENPKLSYLFLRSDEFEKIDKLPKNIKLNSFHTICDPADEAVTFQDYLNYHIQPRKITTNRCHSAILGMILGKKVFMFRNNYHKNRSIWEYSLRDKGVKWLN